MIIYLLTITWQHSLMAEHCVRCDIRTESVSLRPYPDSGGWSPFSNRERPSFSSDPVCVKFAGHKMAMGLVYSQYVSFPFSVSPHQHSAAHLQRNTTLYEKDKRAKPWNPQGIALSIISKHWIGNSSYFFQYSKCKWSGKLKMNCLSPDFCCISAFA
jgi:hypothetical protein